MVLFATKDSAGLGHGLHPRSRIYPCLSFVFPVVPLTPPAIPAPTPPPPRGPQPPVSAPDRPPTVWAWTRGHTGRRRHKHDGQTRADNGGGAVRVRGGCARPHTPTVVTHGSVTLGRAFLTDGPATATYQKRHGPPQGE